MSESSQPTSAHYFWEGLNDLGIEHIFSNFGTDHVSLIEALAQWDQEGRPHPQVILCPHETWPFTWPQVLPQSPGGAKR